MEVRVVDDSMFCLGKETGFGSVKIKSKSNPPSAVSANLKRVRRKINSAVDKMTSNIFRIVSRPEIGLLVLIECDPYARKIAIERIIRKQKKEKH
jgi:hypothetical protein